MAAMIEYVCTAQHERRDEAAVTLEQGAWAYCSYGAGADHKWTKIDPTAVEAVRSIGGPGRARPVVEGTPESTGTSRDPR